MKLSRISNWKQRYLALAFAIPFLGMLLLMLVSGYAPFGKYSMLYSDMYHQYYPFFTAFRRALRRGDGLLYTWSAGLGMDYFGLIAYYLASPLNLVSVLVPDGLELAYFSLLMPMKLGFAGLFFALFLREIFDKNDLSISLFGAFYGLCAWALGYQWNVMWLDSFALTPLVALGTVWLLRDKKVIVYTVSLFLAVFSNYYIGLFVCIFVALEFFCYQICRFQGWGRFFRDLGRIALFSALAIGMTLILELPALAALQNTQSSVNKFPTGFKLNIASSYTFLGLLDAMRQVAGNMGGSLEPSFKEGLPNLYCGVGTLFFAVLYCMAGDVKLRDKICAVALLTFFNLSFIIRQLDYIWHGFHFTNMIPYRFSYLYSFVLLYMGYRAWLLRRKFKPLALVLAFVITAGLLCCSNDLLSGQTVTVFGQSMKIHVFLLYNGAFLALYFCAMLYGNLKKKLPEDAAPQLVRDARLFRYRRRGIARIWALAVIAVELTATLVSFGLYFPGTNTTNYPKGGEEAASMIRYMQEREKDTLFFRAETTHSQTLNDGALNDYNGISCFTSSANVRVTEFMKALGYGAKNTYNRYCYEESSPVANLFLGVKYMIERDGKDKGGVWWTDVHHFGSVHLLENNAYLPLGFLVRSDLGALDISAESDPFALQNDMFAKATGLDRQVWYRIPGEDLNIWGSEVSVSRSGQSNDCAYQDARTNSYVTYAYAVDRDGFMCINLNLPKRNDFFVSVNGIELYRESYSLPQMLAVGDVKTGDLVEIRVQCKAGENGTITIDGAIVDNELFRQGYEMLAQSQWELTRFESTLVEGTIDCAWDGLMYTSIPDNGNWKILVDGASAEPVLVGDVMLGVELTEGTHTVTFRYENRAFSIGWKLSLLCLVAFGGMILVYYPEYRRKMFRKK